MQPFRVAVDRQSYVTFIPTRTAEPLPPVRFAVMIAKYDGSFLFVYNRLRGCWELPGGLVDEGETAQAAAERELFEETGQRTLGSRFLGLLEYITEAREGNLLGALFCCDIEALKPFIPNEEIAELALWSGQESVGVENKGVVSHVDRHLSALYTKQL
jgi:8-oxo-dGTP diphosphatase